MFSIEDEVIDGMSEAPGDEFVVDALGEGADSENCQTQGGNGKVCGEIVHQCSESVQNTENCQNSAGNPQNSPNLLNSQKNSKKYRQRAKNDSPTSLTFERPLRFNNALPPGQKTVRDYA